MDRCRQTLAPVLRQANYYKYRELVPADLLGEVARAKIVITNFHAFKLRDRLDIPKVGRSLFEVETGDRARRRGYGLAGGLGCGPGSIQ